MFSLDCRHLGRCLPRRILILKSLVPSSQLVWWWPVVSRLVLYINKDRLILSVYLLKFYTPFIQRILSLSKHWWLNWIIEESVKVPRRSSNFRPLWCILIFLTYLLGSFGFPEFSQKYFFLSVMLDHGDLKSQVVQSVCLDVCVSRRCLGDCKVAFFREPLPLVYGVTFWYLRMVRVHFSLMLRTLLFQHVVLSNSVLELKLTKLFDDSVVLFLRGFKGLERNHDIFVVLCISECGILFIHMKFCLVILDVVLTG